MTNGIVVKIKIIIVMTFGIGTQRLMTCRYFTTKINGFGHFNTNYYGYSSIKTNE